MNCPNGHGEMKETKLPEFEAAQVLGMRSVKLKNVPAFVCSKCDEKLISGATLDAAHNTLLVLVVTRGFILCAEEVRFIRKALRLSQAQLAEHLNVDRTTVARWETQASPVEGPVSLAIRALALPRVASLQADNKKLIESFEKVQTVAKHHIYDVDAGKAVA